MAERSAAPPAAGMSAWRPTLVIAVGIFATGLGSPALIGYLPFTLLLKNTLRLPPQQVAAFWAVATMPAYVKPLVGLVCDSVPLFGTRRRGYLLAGTIVAAMAWLALAVVPPGYASFLAVMTVLNAALVTAATAVGGMLVEVGQRTGATGRLSAMRSGLEGVMSVVSGRVAAVLTIAAPIWTSITGAFIVALIVPVVLVLHDEPRTARRDATPWASAGGQLRRIVRSSPMWRVSILIFLVYLAPGLRTALVYYQQDVLRLDGNFMGTLQSAGGLGAVAGSLTYAWLCRRVPLQRLVVAGILLNAGAALLYLGYRSAGSALVIDTIAPFLVAIGTLPLYDLAVRATPAGSESFGYALMMSVRNIALFGLSDVLGSALYQRLHAGFAGLVWINAASSAAVLLFVPLLPAALMTAREGRPPESPAPVVTVKPATAKPTLATKPEAD